MSLCSLGPGRDSVFRLFPSQVADASKTIRTYCIIGKQENLYFIGIKGNSTIVSTFWVVFWLYIVKIIVGKDE
jgi:hypothetical protein